MHSVEGIYNFHGRKISAVKYFVHYCCLQITLELCDAFHQILDVSYFTKVMHRSFKVVYLLGFNYNVVDQTETFPGHPYLLPYFGIHPFCSY